MERQGRQQQTPHTAEVRVLFTKRQSGYPELTDALYVSVEDYPKMLADGTIERMKAERWEEWKKRHDAPVQEPAPEVSPAGTSIEAIRQIFADAQAKVDALAAE